MKKDAIPSERTGGTDNAAELHMVRAADQEDIRPVPLDRGVRSRGVGQRRIQREVVQKHSGGSRHVQAVDVERGEGNLDRCGGPFERASSESFGFVSDQKSGSARVRAKLEYALRAGPILSRDQAVVFVQCLKIDIRAVGDVIGAERTCRMFEGGSVPLARNLLSNQGAYSTTD